MSTTSSSRVGPGGLILRYSVPQVVDDIYLFSLSIEIHDLSHHILRTLHPPNSRLNSHRSTHKTAPISYRRYNPVSPLACHPVACVWLLQTPSIIYAGRRTREVCPWQGGMSTSTDRDRYPSLIVPSLWRVLKKALRRIVSKVLHVW